MRNLRKCFSVVADGSTVYSDRSSATGKRDLHRSGGSNDYIAEYAERLWRTSARNRPRRRIPCILPVRFKHKDALRDPLQFWLPTGIAWRLDPGGECGQPAGPAVAGGR